jgi:hypothetical protein
MLFVAWCESSLPIATIPISEFADVLFIPNAAIWAVIIRDKEGFSTIPNRVPSPTQIMQRWHVGLPMHFILSVNAREIVALPAA